MKLKIPSIIIFLFVLFSAAAFGQDQNGVAVAIKNLIDSDVVLSITAWTPASILHAGSTNAMNVKKFIISDAFILILETGNMTFNLDLTRVAAYAYDKKEKALTIYFL